MQAVKATDLTHYTEEPAHEITDLSIVAYGPETDNPDTTTACRVTVDDIVNTTLEQSLAVISIGYDQMQELSHKQQLTPGKFYLVDETNAQHNQWQTGDRCHLCFAIDNTLYADLADRIVKQD